MKVDLPYRFIERLKSLPYVDAIYLYGSRARGDHRLRSDIDLAIECPRAAASEWLNILDVVEDADTLLMIDVIRFDELADGKLKTNIERDMKVIYRKEDTHEPASL